MWCLDAIGLGVSLFLERELGIFWVIIGLPCMRCASMLADLGMYDEEEIRSYVITQSIASNDEFL